MSESIIEALIAGFSGIIGTIIGAVISRLTINIDFSKDKKQDNDNIYKHYMQSKNELKATRKVVKNNRNSNIKIFLKTVICIISFLLGIIIYIVLGQLIPKTKENNALNEENQRLNIRIDNLNDELSSYEKQNGFSNNTKNYTELKMRLSKDAAYSINFLQEASFNNQEHLLYLYNTFIKLLYELENKDDIDLNILIENMEQAEKDLQYYMSIKRD